MLPLCILPLGALLAWTTRAASIPSVTNTIETTTLSNLTSTQSQSQSDNNVRKIAYCTKMPRWFVPAPEPEDCMGVLDYLYIETADSQFRKSKEFRAPGAKKISHASPVQTPRKYTFRRVSNLSVIRFPPTAQKKHSSHLSYNFNSSHQFQSLNLPKNSHSQLTCIILFLHPGTCTLAIVMLSDFPNPAFLPGGYKTGQTADTSTYYNIWKAAGNVIETCFQDRRAVGWQATGKYPKFHSLLPLQSRSQLSLAV